MSRLPLTRTLALLASALVLVAATAWSLTATAHHPVASLGDPIADDSPTLHSDAVEETAPGANLLKTQGEAGHLVNGDGAVLFSISVNSIDVVAGCPSRAQDLEFATGSFVVLDVTAHVSSQILDFSPEADEDVYFPLLPETFALFDTGGEQIHRTASHAAWECFDDDVLLPSFIFPGETQRGLVVLDSAVQSGSIAYMPADAPGWEWNF